MATVLPAKKWRRKSSRPRATSRLILGKSARTPRKNGRLPPKIAHSKPPGSLRSLSVQSKQNYKTTTQEHAGSQPMDCPRRAAVLRANLEILPRSVPAIRTPWVGAEEGVRSFVSGSEHLQLNEDKQHSGASSKQQPRYHHRIAVNDADDRFEIIFLHESVLPGSLRRSSVSARNLLRPKTVRIVRCRSCKYSGKRFWSRIARDTPAPSCHPGGHRKSASRSSIFPEERGNP